MVSHMCLIILPVLFAISPRHVLSESEPLGKQYRCVCFAKNRV